MLQMIDGNLIYVVEVTGFPRQFTPVIWNAERERPYAIALDSAIKSGIVTAPGKYGVEATYDKYHLTFHIYAIKE